MSFEVSIELAPKRFLEPLSDGLAVTLAIIRDNQLIAYRDTRRKRQYLYFSEDQSYDIDSTTLRCVGGEQHDIDQFLAGAEEHKLTLTKYYDCIMNSPARHFVNYANTKNCVVAAIDKHHLRYIENIAEFIDDTLREHVVESTGPCFAGTFSLLTPLGNSQRYFYRLTPTDDNPGEYGECTMDELLPLRDHFRNVSYIRQHSDGQYLAGSMEPSQ